jgi:hypothetical protein
VRFALRCVPANTILRFEIVAHCDPPFVTLVGVGCAIDMPRTRHVDLSASRGSPAPRGAVVRPAFRQQTASHRSNPSAVRSASLQR